MKRHSAVLEPTAGDRHLNLQRQWQAGLALLILAATLFVFWSSLSGGFVDWDDDVNILENLDFRGLSWTHLRWMFTTRFMGPYQPLSWLSLAIDYTFWGLNPFGYHLTSVLLHAANAVVFFAVSLRLLALAKPWAEAEKPWALPVSAAFAALLFAIHPLRVESVAWVTERRDVLSGLFYLLTLWFYLGRRIGLSVVFFALSLLSKGLGMTLPAILLVLDVYPLRRLSLPGFNQRQPGGIGAVPMFSSVARLIWLEKIPFIALAAFAAAMAFVGQKEAGVVHGLAEYGIMERISTVFFNLSFYLEKTLWPTRLYQLYEAPKPVALWSPAYWPRAAAVISLLGVLVWAARWGPGEWTRKDVVSAPRWPAGLAAMLCYAAALLPVIGIVKFGQGIAADRYSYLACLGWAVLGGAVLRKVLSVSRPARALSLAAALSLCAVLGRTTQRQVRVWHDSESLWRHFLRFIPDHVFGNNNLGNTLADQGRYEEAMRHYKIALSVDPGSAYARYNLGNAFVRTGRLEEAIEQYQAALRSDPNYAQAKHNLAVARSLHLNNRGIESVQRGKLKEAIVLFRSAVQNDPRNIAAYNNLGAALSDLGEASEAEKMFRAGLDVDPRSPDIHNSWGVALLKAGRTDAAVEHFRQALRLKPDHPGAARNLRILSKQP